MSSPHTAWQRLLASCSVPRLLIGASVFRLLGGLTILYQYAINYEQRRYLFGPDGVWPYEAFTRQLAQSGSFSLYALGRSPWLFECLFHLGILVAALWAAGWRTRWMTPLNLVLWWSLRERFPLLWDGGDNLMQLLLWYGLFADLGAHLSLDAARRRPPERPPGPRAAALAMVHNTAVLAFAIQLCLVYGIAGLSKVQGETWRNGTALYYALRAGEFTWPGLSGAIYHNAVLLTVLAYVTVAYQVSFTFLLFMNRYTRVAAVCCGVLFHIGIGSFMGLVTFALFMMSADLALLPDAEYRALGAWLARRHVTAAPP